LENKHNPLLTILTIFFMLMLGTAAFAQNESLQELNDNSVRLYGQGQYNEAAELAERALKIADDTLGPYNPQTAIFLNNLAVIYFAQAKYAEAEALYERALGITEQSFGSDHPRVKSLVEGIEKCRQKLSEQELPEDSDESGEIAELSDSPDSSPRAEPEQEQTLTDVGRAIKESISSSGKFPQKLYTVQVGAFRNLLSAKTLQDRLDKNGYDVSITSVTAENGETLHKVQVGEFSERKRAEALAREIKTLMGLDTYITTK
jgi:tetratricopeptide (TPR) repeat protein